MGPFRCPTHAICLQHRSSQPLTFSASEFGEFVLDAFQYKDYLNHGEGVKDFSGHFSGFEGYNLPNPEHASSLIIATPFFSIAAFALPGEEMFESSRHIEQYKYLNEILRGVYGYQYFPPHSITRRVMGEIPHERPVGLPSSIWKCPTVEIIYTWTTVRL